MWANDYAVNINMQLGWIYFVNTSQSRNALYEHRRVEIYMQRSVAQLSEYTHDTVPDNVSSWYFKLAHVSKFVFVPSTLVLLVKKSNR